MEQFERFCNEIIKTLVKPQVTVVSGKNNQIILFKNNFIFSYNKKLGDLVNSAGNFRDEHDRILTTAQYEQEWKIYRDILERTNVTKYTKWLDLKGNHGKSKIVITHREKEECLFFFLDAFMDPDPDSTKSFYR